MDGIPNTGIMKNASHLPTSNYDWGICILNVRNAEKSKYTSYHIHYSEDVRLDIIAAVVLNKFRVSHHHGLHPALSADGALPPGLHWFCSPALFPLPLLSIDPTLPAHALLDCLNHGVYIQHIIVADTGLTCKSTHLELHKGCVNLRYRDFSFFWETLQYFLGRLHGALESQEGH